MFFHLSTRLEQERKPWTEESQGHLREGELGSLTLGKRSREGAHWDSGATQKGSRNWEAELEAAGIWTDFSCFPGCSPISQPAL